MGRRAKPVAVGWRQLSTRRWAASVLAALAALPVLVGCGASDPAPTAASPPPGSASTETAAESSHPQSESSSAAPSDTSSAPSASSESGSQDLANVVRVTACEPGTAGTLYAEVEVINTDTTSASYAATVVFTDGSGTVLSEGAVAQEGLAPGETRTVGVPTIDRAPSGGYQCVIEDARRLD